MHKHSRVSIVLKVFLFLIVFLIFGFFAGLMVLEGPVQTSSGVAKNNISNISEKDFIVCNTSYIYDKDGNLLGRYSGGEGYGVYTRYDEIPTNVVNAFVSIEDRTFWTNQGYDMKGIMRVVAKYIVTRGNEKNGASTITQQLMRMRFLTPQKTLSRKLREIFLANAATEKFTKRQIMEFYVNDCYFANGVYGIGGASRYYFSKEPKDLSLSEAAYLCAIPNRPSWYDPKADATRAIPRRNKILRDMQEEGYINQTQMEEAMKEEIHLNLQGKYKPKNYMASYALDCVIKEIMANDGFEFEYDRKKTGEYKAYRTRYGKAYDQAKQEFLMGGYVVKTSLDSSIQKKAQTALNEGLEDTSLQGAITVIDDTTGKVIAAVGGKTKPHTVYNRAYQAYRQPGSSIKPLIVYTPALERDYTPDTVLNNIDVSKAKHLKKISDVLAMDGEPLTLRESVERSINGSAYSLFASLRPRTGLKYLQKMEFSHLVKPDETLSAALGGLTYGVNTVEMASAYEALNHNGTWRDPSCVVSMKDMNGIERHQSQKREEVYSTLASATMIDVLKGVIKNGTAKDMGWKEDMPAAGKTGTTNDKKDGWFCGITPYYSVSVWVGKDTPKSIDDLLGNTYPASIWKNTMQSLVENKEVKEFSAIEKHPEVAVKKKKTNEEKNTKENIEERMEEE